MRDIEAQEAIQKKELEEVISYKKKTNINIYRK